MSYATRTLVALLVFMSLAWTSGCSKPPERQKKPGFSREENPLEVALDRLRRASSTLGYREALNLINAQISKDDRAALALSPKAREVLQQRYLLDDDEVKEIEALSFSSLDVHHLEGCYQMRETARFLELKEANPLEQATRCFEWVVRQVDLHERKDDPLPPQAVLRLGRGTAAERVLVFLAVLHQFQLDGCVVALPGERAEEPGPFVAGVLIPEDKKTEIYLFDPRLGRPLPGPEGKGVATLAQARRTPELLWPAGNPTAAKGELTVFVAPPLSSLSPRMRYLETLLVDRERVYVAHDPEKLLTRALEAAKDKESRPVRVWNRRTAAGATPAVTPLRVLRSYLPLGDGGTDGTGRIVFITRQMFAAMPAIVRNFRMMRLINPRELAPSAKDTLLEKTLELFAKYVHSGRDFVVRGQMTQLRQRLHILQGPLEDLNLDIDQKRIEEWRERVNKAVLGKHPGVVWEEDNYFRGLLATRADLDPKDIRDLTIIVLRAIREPIGQEFVYLQAHAKQEEAEKAGARSVTGKASKGPLQWQEAQNEWQRYLNRFGLTPANLKNRLDLLRDMFVERDAEIFISVEQFMTDLHRTFAARFLLARDLERGNKRGQAIAELQGLIADVKDLEKRELGKALGDFAGLSPDRFWARRFESFQKDLGPEGGFAWLRRAAELQFREWTAKS